MQGISKKDNRRTLVDDILVEREERGPVSVLTMVYRPYNLLGPKLTEAIATGGCVLQFPFRPHPTLNVCAGFGQQSFEDSLSGLLV